MLKNHFVGFKKTIWLHEANCCLAIRYQLCYKPITMLKLKEYKPTSTSKWRSLHLLHKYGFWNVWHEKSIEFIYQQFISISAICIQQVIGLYQLLYFIYRTMYMFVFIDVESRKSFIIPFKTCNDLFKCCHCITSNIIIMSNNHIPWYIL